MRPLSETGSVTVRANTEQGLFENSEMAFSVRYSKNNGMQFFTGNFGQGHASGSPLTEDPMIPTALGNPEPGLYELKTANDFFDPIFRYIALDGIELQWRPVPVSTALTKYEEESKYVTATNYNMVNDLGTVRVGPWYGEPGMFQLDNGGVNFQYLDENYINQVQPQMVSRYPTQVPTTERDPDADWLTAGFMPIVPEVVNGDTEDDPLQVAFQRLAPVNTIDWVAGNSQLSGNLGWWMWYYPHATLATNAVGTTLATQYMSAYEYRFKVRVTWFDMLPLQMFEYPTPTVDAAKFKEWADKVLAADQAAQAQELADIALYKEQTGGAAPPPPSPTAELADDMADTELVDPDDMDDTAPPPLKRAK